METLDEMSRQTLETLEGLGGGVPDNNVTSRRYKLKLEDYCEANGLTEYECELLYNEGEVSVAGYAHVQVNGHDVLTPVAFISKTFKNKIDERLDDLASLRHSNISEARQGLYDIIITLVQGLLGETTAEATIMEMTFNDIWKILLQVPFSDNSPLRVKKIKDIKNGNIDSDDLMVFIDNFKEQAEDFQDFPLEKDLRSSTFKNGDQTFYWIPFSKIPRGGE